MRKNTIQVLCKVLCVVMLAGFVLEAPLLASQNAITVKAGNQSVQVTPGQWVTVNQPNGGVVHYNVRYVNGQPVALEMSQYMQFLFGKGGTTGTAVAGSTAAQTSGASASQASQASQAAQGTQAGTVAGSAAQAADTSAAKASTGSWIKDELSNYGSSIKESFQSGKESGQNFGTKTVDTAKSAGSKVVSGAKGIGSKIGDLLRSAKERISNIFKPKAKVDAAKGSQSGDASQSGQSGDASQSGQSGDASQSGQSGDASQSGQSGDASQSGQASQSQSEQAGDASQAGQSDQATQIDPKTGKPSLKEVSTSKFKAGYQKAKTMVGQGVQNVKDSLKSGFSAKNILMTAGITVGVDLATQIINGEKPSLQKALKTVVSAEFAGGVVGSVTGAAAGSFFVPFLSAVPVVGGVLSALAPTFGSIVGGSVGSYLAGDLKNGRFSLKEAFKRVDWVGVAGQTVGSTLGSMLGSMIFPPFGTIIGGIVGGMVGNWAAHKIASLFGKGGQVSTGTVGMPVGTNPYSSTGSQISIGSVAGNSGSEIPVSGDQSVSAPTVSVSGDVAAVGSYASEVQLAYAKYQELYRLYNEMLAQGRQSDAVKVATEMNKAKADYETLKAKYNK